LQLKPIGVIHSPFKTPGEAPFQGRLTRETATLEVYAEFVPGLKDVEQASHLIVLYWCDRADRERLQTRTPHGPEIRGVFACRSPSRSNPIAFCVWNSSGGKETACSYGGATRWTKARCWTSNRILPASIRFRKPGCPGLRHNATSSLLI